MRSMAFLAPRRDVAQAVGGFPVSVEIPPRFYMMDIQRSAEFFLCNATFLAGVVIALSCCSFLLRPIRPPSFFVSSLPVEMVGTPLPISEALSGAKPLIFSTFNHECADIYNAAAPATRQLSVASFYSALPRTGVNLFRLAWSKAHYFSASARFIDSYFLRLSVTCVRAKPVLTRAALVGERPLAKFTNVKNLHRFSEANAPAELLGWAENLGYHLATLDARPWFHCGFCIATLSRAEHRFGMLDIHENRTAFLASWHIPTLQQSLL